MAKKLMAKVFACILAVLILSASLVAGAAERDDFISCNYVRITGENFVCDTLNGVEAYYNLYGRIWYCTEYVNRYYETIYGVTLRFNAHGPYIISDTECYLSKLTENDEPKTGDIIFWPVNLRNKNYYHTAIVKSFEDGAITLIEQNWVYGSACAYERKIKWPSANYYAFTLVDPTIPLYMTATDDIVPIDEDIPAVDVVSSPCTPNNFINACSSALSGKVSVSLVSGNTLSLVMGLDSMDGTMTREQAFVYVYKLLKAADIEMPKVDTDAALSIFVDQDEISEDARDAVAALTSLGLVYGGLNMKCAPHDLLTTEQCSVLMMRTASLFN